MMQQVMERVRSLSYAPLAKGVTLGRFRSHHGPCGAKNRPRRDDAVERDALALRSGERRGARGLRGDGREPRAPLDASIRLDRPDRVGKVNVGGRYRRYLRIQGKRGRRVGRWLLVPHLHPAVIATFCDGRSSRPRRRRVAAADREGGDIDTPTPTRRKRHVPRQSEGRA